MGNREDLLAGARKAILEKGVAKTTARDIAAAAGVSLAAIGYHFGSKDRLVTEALTEAAGAGLGEGLMTAIRNAGAGRTPGDAFGHVWEDMAEVFARNREGLLAQAENLLRMHRNAESNEFMADAGERAIAGTAEVLRETHPELTEPQARALATFYFILFNGLAMTWISAPGAALPTGAEYAQALAALTT